MSKAIEENKLKVTTKEILWEFNLFWKFMSNPVTVFLIDEKLLSLWL